MSSILDKTDTTMVNNVKFYNSILKMTESRRKILEAPFQFDFKQDMLTNKQFFNSTYARACRGKWLRNITVSSYDDNLLFLLATSYGISDRKGKHSGILFQMK